MAIDGVEGGDPLKKPNLCKVSVVLAMTRSLNRHKFLSSTLTFLYCSAQDFFKAPTQSAR